MESIDSSSDAATSISQSLSRTTYSEGSSKDGKIVHFMKTTVGEVLGNSNNDDSNGSPEAYILIPYPDKINEVREELGEDYAKWFDTFKDKKWFVKWMKKHLGNNPGTRCPNSGDEKDTTVTEKQSDQTYALDIPDIPTYDRFVLKCFICKKKVRSIASHMKSKHPELAHNQCQQCFKVLGSAETLQRHMWIHEDIRPYECRKCQKSFRSATNLKLHDAWNHNRKKLKDYTCKVCGNVTHTSGAFNVHMRIHSGVKPHKCGICGSAFAQISTLHQHIQRHRLALNPDLKDKLKRFHCSKCEMKFLRQGDLTRHFAFKHTDQTEIRKKNVCSICKKGFGLKSSLDKHMFTHEAFVIHQSKDVADLGRCPLCVKSFSGLASLKRHLKNIHAKETITTYAKGGNEALNIKCPMCFSSKDIFSSKSDFSQHLIDKHKPVKQTFKCDICEKVVSRMDTYNIHMKSHKSKNGTV